MQPENVENPGSKEPYSYLPSVELLAVKLDMLGRAERLGDIEEAAAIEEDIKQMVTSGIIEGYPDCKSRKKGVPEQCMLVGIERVNAAADEDTFCINYLLLSDSDPDKLRSMLLWDFLSPQWLQAGDTQTDACHEDCLPVPINCS